MAIKFRYLPVLLLILCLTGCTGTVQGNTSAAKAEDDIYIYVPDESDTPPTEYEQEIASRYGNTSVVDEANQNASGAALASGNYCASVNAKKFHKSDCPFAKRISDENRFFSNDRQTMISKGYEPCKQCNP